MPARPHLLEFGRVAVGAHLDLKVFAGDGLAAQAATAPAIGGRQARCDGAELGGGSLAGWRRQIKPTAQDVELAPGVVAQAFRLEMLGCFKGKADAHLRSACSEIGGERIRVIGDVGAVHPASAGFKDGEVCQLLFHADKKGLSFRCSGHSSSGRLSFRLHDR